VGGENFRIEPDQLQPLKGLFLSSQFSIKFQAMNKNRKLFEKEEIIQVLSAGQNKTSNAIIKDISLAINKFVDG
jgi:hypothetical protein